MNFAVYKYIIGYLKFTYEEDTLISVEYSKECDNFGSKTTFTEEINKQFSEYFNGERKEFNIKYKLSGTSFEQRVYKALSEISYGEVRTYKDIAIMVGSEKAYRAVGMANNKNKLLIIIPCHRVIGVNNKLVGFACGLDVKEYLLNLEKSNNNE